MKNNLILFSRIRETEVYNVNSGEFEKGPDLPVSFFKSPCAARTRTNTIRILGMTSNPEENNQFYEYLPGTNTFNKLPDMPGRAMDMICNVDVHQGGEQFFAFGGYS